MNYLAKLLCIPALTGNMRAKACFNLSRVFLVCTAVLIAVMPWTEYFWHFDRFLRGGQDFELSLIAVFTSLCLMLLLFQLGQESRQLAIVLRRSLVHIFRTGRPVLLPAACSGLIDSLCAIPLPSPTPGRYSLPLLI